MDNRNLLLAYQEAVRKAQLAGRPVSREEVYTSLYPVLMDYRRQGQQDQSIGLQKEGLALDRSRLEQDQSHFGQTLAANRDIFNNQMNLTRSGQDEANRIGLINLGVSGVGSLGVSLAAMKQNAEMMNLLKRRYPDMYR